VETIHRSSEHSCSDVLLGVIPVISIHSKMFIAGTNPKIIQRLLVHPTIGVELNAYSYHLPGVSGEATKNVNKIFEAG